MRTAELPHETAIREQRAAPVRSLWQPTAELIAATATFAGIPEAHAKRILFSCVGFRGGLDDALSFESREGLAWDVDASFLKYGQAVEAAAQMKAAA
ncbi:MAG: hypothetical protein ACT6TH_15420 [Brevundimonas sp.]|uniref:hypothetical protein n=1 Tax=Brevundimonas sp. TaxID=1871086 RepID=UPI0040341DF0